MDAAMRELWITGYIPNYMRHVVAGFLIEFLSIDWRHGELWFHDTLVDADVAIQAGARLFTLHARFLSEFMA